MKIRHRTLTEKRLTNLNADSINVEANKLEKIAANMSAISDFIDHPLPVEYLTDYPIVRKSCDVRDLMIAERAVMAAGSKTPRATSR